MILTIFASTTACTVVGCAKSASATATKPLSGDVAGATGELDGRGRDEAGATMRSVVPQGFVPLAPQPLGVRRWSDVSAAAAAACNEVEMAVLRGVVNDTDATFTLTTLDSRAGTLIVRRVDEPTLVEPKAVVGNFDEDTTTASKLVAAFDRAMDAAAKRRQLEDYRVPSAVARP